MTKELKRFEQWWDAEDDIPNDGPYTPDTPIQFAWAGWQAALAQPERLAELGWQEIDCPICGGGARAFPKPEQEPMHPEIKKMYEDYFDKCFRESSSAVPENFMDALRFDVAVRDAREWEKVDMREHAEGNLGIGTAPPPQQRKWVGLTYEEVQEIHDTYHKRMGPQEFASMIEAKLKEKNG